MANDNGGIIGIINTPTADTASGVWSLDSQYQAQTTGTWPPVPAIGLNSARFDVGSSDYLNRTLGAPTSDKIFTISAWVKRSTLGVEGYVFTIGSNGGSSPSHWYSIRYANEKIYVQRSGTGQLITNAVYRDLSAWYHIVLTNDTTQSTDSKGSLNP